MDGAFDTLGCKWGKRTKEQIEKTASKNRGRKRSEEDIAKQSKTIKKLWETNEYREKQKNSDKTKLKKHLQKISLERIGKISIEKNGERKYINEDEYEKYLKDGWKRRGVEYKPSYEEIKKYRENGYSYSRIGKIYGVGESCVRYWVRKFKRNINKEK